MSNALTVKDYVSIRNDMLYKQHDLYVSAIKNINAQNRELLKNDFGITLVKNCAWDAADAIVSKYFNTADYYISVQQMVDRVMNFTYDNDIDPLNDNNAIRKTFYENENTKNILTDLTLQSEKAGRYLFTEERKKDPLEKQTKAYRNDRISKDKLFDDITGKEGSYYTVIVNDKEQQRSDLHADHIQARDSIKYDSRYIQKDKLDDLRASFYSEHNFWLIHASANTSKGAVRVCKTDNGIMYLSSKEYNDRLKDGTIKEENDITSKATAEQLAEATIYMWEKETKSNDKIEKLKQEGYLDENGKVLPQVKEKLLIEVKKSMNAESNVILKSLDYSKIMDDAFGYTKKSLSKILVGQVIYYVLPPMVFETKTLIKRKNTTLDQFFAEIQKSSKRVVKYVTSKLGEIFKNVVGNAFSKFIKTFFDIIIEAVKETAKRLVRMAKQLVLSLVNCVKIIANKNSSPAEKADAVTKTLAVTITSVLLEVLFEWAEIELGLPDILMEPLQFIATILLTNLVMLILQKADLFDVQYGLLVANIERVFETEYQNYIEETTELIQASQENISHIINDITSQIHEIENSIETLNLYEDDVIASLNVINSIFDMGIDFDKEWQDFISVNNGG